MLALALCIVVRVDAIQSALIQTASTKAREGRVESKATTCFLELLSTSGEREGASSLGWSSEDVGIEPGTALL